MTTGEIVFAVLAFVAYFAVVFGSRQVRKGVLWLVGGVAAAWLVLGFGWYYLLLMVAFGSRQLLTEVLPVLVLIGGPIGLATGLVRGHGRARSDLGTYLWIVGGCIAGAVALSWPLMSGVQTLQRQIDQYVSVTLPSERSADWPRPTALEALRASMPELQRRLPTGTVKALAAEPVRADGRAGVWRVNVIEPWGKGTPVRGSYPASSRWLLYRHWGAVVTGNTDGFLAGIHAGERLLVPLAEPERLPELLDSDVALRLAEEQIGAAFRDGTGAEVRRLELVCAPVCLWKVSYKAAGISELTVVVDATTGLVEVASSVCVAGGSCDEVPSSFADGRAVVTPTPLPTPTRFVPPTPTVGVRP